MNRQSTSRAAMLSALLLGFALAAPGHAQQADVPVRVRGELTVTFKDDLDRGRFEIAYELREEASGRTWELDFPGGPPADLRSGAIVAARGHARGSQLVVGAAEGGDPGIETLVAAPELAVTSTQRVIVIAGDFNDAALACTQTAIEDRFFNDPNQQSVDDLYREMSFQQVELTGTVVGPYRIHYDSTTCDHSNWALALEAAAQARGVDLASYNRRVYVLPPSACGWLGYGSLGGNPSRAWIFTCNRTGTYAHEIGHNLGMHHASTPSSEYGDTSDIMGVSSPLKHVNAAHKAQLGWLPPRQVLPVTASGSYEIAALEVDPSQAVAPQALRIAKPDTSESYYLSYRQPAGFDAILPASLVQGTSVHRYPGGVRQTFLLDTLVDGESFVDAANGILVTQVGRTSTTVRLDISLNTSCSRAAPAMPLSPSTQTGSPGSALSYSVSVSNTDGAACPSSTWALTPSVPAGWGASVTPATLTLAPGQTGSAVVSVVSPLAAADGDYASFSVEASDASVATHAASVSGSYQVVVDREAPSAPSGLSAKQRQLRVSLTWTAARDNVAVVGYAIARNGVRIGSSATTGFSDAVAGAGTYAYTVTAHDAAGNVSAASAPVSVVVGSSGKRSRDR